MMFAPRSFLTSFLLAFFFLAAGQSQNSALTLEDLKGDSRLTPERLMHYFSNFHFLLGEKVQPADQFLANEAGDCDDFANLAADLLRDKGYTPRLVVVFMPKEIHVVCYVAEVKAYLDYNNRAMEKPLVASDGSLSDIAEKVAKSFSTTWHCASEFTMNDGVRRFVYTDFRQAEPSKHPKLDGVIAAAKERGN